MKTLLAFPASAIKESKKATPDVVSIKQPKKIFEFGLPDIIAYSQRNITVPRPVRSCRRFLQDSFILSFSLKNMNRSTPPNCLLSNPLHYHFLPIRNTAYRSGLCTSSKYISYSRSRRNTYPLALPALLAILFQKIKTSCVRMTKIGNVQNSG